MIQGHSEDFGLNSFLISFENLFMFYNLYYFVKHYPSHSLAIFPKISKWDGLLNSYLDSFHHIIRKIIK